MTKRGPLLIDGKPFRGRILFAHGAGAGMESEFMSDVARQLVDIGLEVVRFDFPYMQRSRLDGRRRPPDRMPVLVQCMADIEGYFNDGVPLYLAGKSMGGRVASMLLAGSRAAAAFVFGYPFHPAGKPEALRIAHFAEGVKPVLIFQGTRDAMGRRDEVLHYGLPEQVVLHWLEDGDHDLKPRKASGFSQQQLVGCAIERIEEFLR